MTSEERLVATLNVPGMAVRRSAIRGHQINWMECGTGLPLLLIHGGTFGWGAWFANIAALSKQFKVYAPDLPGAGRSTPADYRTIPFTEYLEVLREFIAQNGIRDFDIIGHSFGGWLALKLAESHPSVRRLVLVDPVGFSLRKSFQDRLVSIYPMAKLLAKTALNPQNERAIEGFLRDVFYDKETPMPQAFLEYFFETTRTHHNILFVHRMVKSQKELFMGNSSFPEKKTLFLWGENDAITPFEDAKRYLGKAALESFPKTGHAPQIERREEFNDIVKEFLLFT